MDGCSRTGALEDQIAQELAAREVVPENKDGRTEQVSTQEMEIIQSSQGPFGGEAYSSQEMETVGEDKGKEKEIVENEDQNRQENTTPFWEGMNLEGDQLHSIDFNKKLVHDEDGVRWIDKDKWPRLEIDSANKTGKEGPEVQVDEDTETEAEVTKAGEEEENITSKGGWTQTKSGRKKAPKRQKPVVAARKSTRARSAEGAGENHMSNIEAECSEMESSPKRSRKGEAGRADGGDKDMAKELQQEEPKTGDCGRLLLSVEI
ncbi:unnamed protein product [Urochloa humidicola]